MRINELVKEHQRKESSPPGRIKIIEAFKSIMEEKSFEAITWAEIANTAGVAEGLIYRHFKTKRNLLHEVLDELSYDYYLILNREVEGVEGALNKIRKYIFVTMQSNQQSTLLSKILLIEGRTFPDFFKSEAYEKVRKNVGVIKDFIKEGIESGEIRDDIPVQRISQMIAGIMEYMLLPKLLFKRPIDPESLTEDVCKFIFMGIVKKNDPTKEQISSDRGDQKDRDY